MKKVIIIIAALALAFSSCIRNGHNNPNNQQTPNEPTPNEQPQTVEMEMEEEEEAEEEEVLFGIGDLNHDGFTDSAVITLKEVYHNLVEGVTPAKGDGLKVFMGDEQGNYHLFGTYPINNHSDENFATWDAITIGEDELLTIVDVFRTDDGKVFTYILEYQDDDLYLTDFGVEYGTDEYNSAYYDLVDNKLEMEIEWYEMDTDINHYRMDTYELKDLPLKKLSEFRIGDEVCVFDEYVAHVDEEIFEMSGTTKEALCSAENDPSYDEGDLNGDGIDDLVINVNSARFAVYLQDSDGVYNFMCEGKRCDEWTEVEAYVKEGKLGVYAFTESSKEYMFRYDDGYFHLLSFEQSMYWPDGEGYEYQFIDFANGKRTQQEDENPQTVTDIPQRPLRVIEEIHFGNIDEIEKFIEE